MIHSMPPARDFIVYGCKDTTFFRNMQEKGIYAHRNRIENKHFFIIELGRF